MKDDILNVLGVLFFVGLFAWIIFWEVYGPGVDMGY